MQAVEPGQADAAARRGHARARWLLFLALVTALILVPFLLFEDDLAAWTTRALNGARERPLAGAAIIVALLGGDAVLPVPSSIVSAFAGGAFGWGWGAVVIWTGMSVGCLLSYSLGRGAARGLALPLVGAGELARARRWFTTVGPAALIVTRAVPVAGEAAALVAGAARMPFASFLLSTAIANLAVAIAYAGIGAAAASSRSFLIAFFGLVCVPALAWGCWRYLAARGRDAGV